MTLDLSQPQLNSLISAAILEKLSPEQRDTLIRKALESLFESDPYRGSNQKTRLQIAFDDAAQNTARALVAERLAGDEKFKASIAGMIERVVAVSIQKMLDEGKTNALADSLISWLTKDSY